MGNSYTAQTFIDAIPGTGGIVSAIARKVGCEWNTALREAVALHADLLQHYRLMAGI